MADVKKEESLGKQGKRRVEEEEEREEERDVGRAFAGMHIDDGAILDALQGRSPCPRCRKSRKYFCYTCYVPVDALQGRIPSVRLPVKVDIIKHRRELAGKSTAAHAAVLAPEDVRVYPYPCVPDYGRDDGVVLIYPSKTAMSLEEYLQTRGSASVRRVVLIDSTWPQSRGVVRDARLQALPCLRLRRQRRSLFWRHQRGCPRSHLATVEALHQCLRELRPDANAAFDNLLFFFRHMYAAIRGRRDAYQAPPPPTPIQLSA